MISHIEGPNDQALEIHYYHLAIKLQFYDMLMVIKMMISTIVVFYMEQVQLDGTRNIDTRIVTGKAGSEAIIKRTERIAEALSWEPGPSIEKQRKYILATLADGTEVYFLKPGWETIGKKRPNPHDMTPRVGDSYIDVTFVDIWAHLSRIAIIDFDAFRKVLVLIYRSAYLLDHRKAGEGLRYMPSDQVRTSIDGLDKVFGGALPVGGLWGLLHFLDILGWNEDVKYHTENGRPAFKGRYGPKVGRINTLLTCIRVPFQMHHFAKGIMNVSNDPMNIDFRPGYQMMQDFLKSRGTCVPTNKSIVDWLSPYIHD
jgi:hypothetical protein